MASRQLHLGAFMRPVSIHTAWWRYPTAYPDANFNFQHLKHFAQTLERGKFDASSWPTISPCSTCRFRP
jgi:hypothetical protein